MAIGSQDPSDERKLHCEEISKVFINSFLFWPNHFVIHVWLTIFLKKWRTRSWPRTKLRWICLFFHSNQPNHSWHGWIKTWLGKGQGRAQGLNKSLQLSVGLSDRSLHLTFQDHGQGQSWWSHLRPGVESMCLFFVSWQSGHFWRRYRKFPIWPWKF